MSDEKEKDNYINSNVLFVDQDSPIHEVVNLMVEKKISSVLVKDSKTNTVAGIITERDIVAKFTLIKVEDKLERRANTIMSRPVHFATLDNFHEEIIKLHLEHRIRHFPIINGDTPTIESIVGIVSITDLLHHFIRSKEVPPNNKKMQEQKKAEMPHLGILAKTPEMASIYINVFSKLGFLAEQIKDFGSFLNKNKAKAWPVIFDFDGYSQLELKNLIPVSRKYPGPLLLATSNPQMLTLFKKYLDTKKQDIALKPLNFSYCQWLLTTKLVQAEAQD